MLPIVIANSSELTNSWLFHFYKPLFLYNLQWFTSLMHVRVQQKLFDINLKTIKCKNDGTDEQIGIIRFA